MIAFSKDENFEEFLRLVEDPDYSDVVFDAASGGLGAIHKEHRFDKQVGPLGCPRGDYEKAVLRIMTANGYRLILTSEFPSQEHSKCFDGLLNGAPAEIKAVESTGRWAIRTKLHDSAQKGTPLSILYFPDTLVFSQDRVVNGWKQFLQDGGCIGLHHIVEQVICVVGNDRIEILKPPG